MYPTPQELDNVRNKIWVSFNPSSCKPPVHVVDSSSLNYDAERQRLQLRFAGKQWNELEYKTLCDHRASIPLMNLESFVYYTPAFLLACLELNREQGYDMCSQVMMNLNPINENGEMIDYCVERLLNFSYQQQVALASFVVLFMSCEGLVGNQARIAYPFWKTYLM